MSIYLDYQATTPLAPEARTAMLAWLDGGVNPHAAHAQARAARAAIDLAREQVAALMPPGGKVYFTSGATEALNWAIQSARAEQQQIVTARTEHSAVLNTVTVLATDHKVAMLPLLPDGIVDVARANRAIRPGTSLVAVMLVNNEIGVIQPVDALAELASKVDAYILCDAVQGYGRVSLPQSADYIAISAHKIHGPIGIGALWVRDGAPLKPILHGGAQEGGMRPGTLSPLLVAGFGAAAAVMAARREEDAAHVQALAVKLRDALGPRWHINGSVEQRYAGNLNVHRAGLDSA
ncbi:MAG: aminotransferase class V-fold PLP-dependent enzyme, partial [Alphaproteobacteria bacterium]|nr:aminotransferase class V-fold PLP-dependent enzyme [Alphaproteobacteria bacterium]